MNILPFKKTVIGNIMISVKYDMLEDGTVWYCWKLGEYWSEWEELWRT